MCFFEIRSTLNFKYFAVPMSLELLKLDRSILFFQVIWVKLNEGNNNLFISTGSKIVVPGQRFSIRHDESSSTYTLQITKLQETDTGLYQCQIVIGATSKITADVWVHVRGTSNLPNGMGTFF